MRVEDEYFDVLQNIEFAIVDTYHKNPEMSDYDVMRALEVLIDAYSGEKIGRSPRKFRLSDLEQRLVEEIRTVCEWRLGREELVVEGTSKPVHPRPEPITVDEIIICLKRILKSVNMWNKEGGRQGYLDFIVQHVI